MRDSSKVKLNSYVLQLAVRGERSLPLASTLASGNWGEQWSPAWGKQIHTLHPKKKHGSLAYISPGWFEASYWSLAWMIWGELLITRLDDLRRAIDYLPGFFIQRGLYVISMLRYRGSQPYYLLHQFSFTQGRIKKKTMFGMKVHIVVYIVWSSLVYVTVHRTHRCPSYSLYAECLW